MRIRHDRNGAAQRAEYLRLADQPSGIARVLQTGAAFAVNDAQTSDEMYADRAAELGIASTLFVPVRWSDEIRHVLVVGWNQRHEITAEEIELSQAAADLAAAGLAGLEADEGRAAGSIQDRAVARAARALTASLNPQEIL